MPFYFEFPEKVAKSKQVYDCEKCGQYLNKKLKHPKMTNPFMGNQYNGLVIVADSPSAEEDESGIPLSGELTKKIRSQALMNGINFASEAAITFAACCGKTSKDVSYTCCKPILEKNLSLLKPKMIIALGEYAFKSIMNLKNKYSALEIRNRFVPNYNFNCAVFPVLNPNKAFSYHYKDSIEKDLKRAYSFWKDRFHKRTEVVKFLKERKILENIKIVEVKKSEIKETFDRIKQLKEVALDYETTGNKPYDKWFEVTHITFSIGKLAWVFHESLWENDLEVWDSLIAPNMVDILTNDSILKIIQNSKFEDIVSRFLFGIKEIGNVFCTMLATHTIDERTGCTSLDFQNLVRFGIPPYSDTVKSHLQKKEKNDFINTIRKAPHRDLIQYAGLDGITTFANYRVLNDVLLPNAYPKARENYEFLLKGHKVFANMSCRGIAIDGDYFEKLDGIILSNMERIANEIKSDSKVMEFNELLRSEQKPKKKTKNTEKILMDFNDNKPLKRKLKPAIE